MAFSEVALGDVNSRTPSCALYRTWSLPRLGDLTLGDLAEIEWRPLTEMQICTSVLTSPDPYALTDPATHQQRLQCQRILPGTPLGVLRLGDLGQCDPITSGRQATRT